MIPVGSPPLLNCPHLAQMRVRHRQERYEHLVSLLLNGADHEQTCFGPLSFPSQLTMNNSLSSSALTGNPPGPFVHEVSQKFLIVLINEGLVRVIVLVGRSLSCFTLAFSTIAFTTFGFCRCDIVRASCRAGIIPHGS